MNLNKLQITQNTALRIATGCTADTNTTHLHQETQTLPLKTHLTLHANQLKTKATQQHPLHTLLNQPTPRRKQKVSLFLNATYNNHIQTGPNPTKETITETIKTTHTQIVKEHIDSLPNNKVTNSPFLQIHPSEESLPQQLRCTLAQLRTDKSPFLMAYKHHINPTT